MIGTVGLEGLEIECVIGVLPEEREAAQTLSVDVEMDLDFAAATGGDDISETVDYADVATRLRELARMGKFQLIESLSEAAARLILASYPRCQSTRVTVRKPMGALKASSALARVERGRSVDSD